MNTTYFLNLLAGAVFHTDDSEIPEEYYIGLSTTEPSADGTGFTEPSSDYGYARVAITQLLGEPSGGVVTNSYAIDFPSSTADWGTVTHFIIFDALEDGNLLMFGELSVSRSVEVGTIVSIQAEALTLTVQDAT